MSRTVCIVIFINEAEIHHDIINYSLHEIHISCAFTINVIKKGTLKVQHLSSECSLQCVCVYTTTEKRIFSCIKPGKTSIFLIYK